MTPLERAQKYLNAASLARANAATHRSMANEWPHEADRYNSEAMLADERAEHYERWAAKLIEIARESSHAIAAE